MEIKEDFKNSLIGRREIVAVVESIGNPGFASVKKDLIKKLGLDEKLIIVKKVGSKFGSKSFDIEAFVYDSVESRAKIESAPEEVKQEVPVVSEEKKEEKAGASK